MFSRFFIRNKIQSSELERERDTVKNMLCRGTEICRTALRGCIKAIYGGLPPFSLERYMGTYVFGRAFSECNKRMDKLIKLDRAQCEEGRISLLKKQDTKVRRIACHWQISEDRSGAGENQTSEKGTFNNRKILLLREKLVLSL